MAGCGFFDDSNVKLAATVATSQVSAEPGAYVQTDLRVTFREPAKKLGHRSAEDIFRKPDMNRCRAGRIAQRSRRLLLKGNNPTGVSKKALSRGRRTDRTSIPIQQGLPDCILKPSKLLAQGRLCHMQALGRFGEASRLNDCDESSQEAWVEHFVPLGQVLIMQNMDD